MGLVVPVGLHLRVVKLGGKAAAIEQLRIAWQIARQRRRTHDERPLADPPKLWQVDQHVPNAMRAIPRSQVDDLRLPAHLELLHELLDRVYAV